MRRVCGDRQTIELTRAQGKSIEKHQQMMEVVSEAKLACQMEIQKVELVDEQLAEAEENSSDLKLAVDELLIEGEELAEGDAGQDRTAMAGELTTLQREENKLSEEARAVENRLRDTERKLVVARTELESRSGSRDGMARAVQALLGRRDSGEQKGILGTISEMCSPKDSSHEDALATAIGGGMNSIIVENDQVAAECIGWLRQNRVGRATFLPLNKIQVGRASGRAMMLTRQPGVVGFAWEMLDHDPRIETAVRYVLRDTLIVQDLSTARKNMGGVRMVTLQGGVTEAGGAMVGGSKVRLKVSFGGRIQGMNEVDKLDAEVIRLQILADKVCDQLTACRRKQQELKQRIDNISEDDRSMRKRQWKEDLRLSEQRLAKATGVVVAVKKKLETIEKKCSQKEQQLARAEEALRVSSLAREVASAALQEVSPQHLQLTLREVQEVRVKAFEDQAISKAIIDGGAEKGKILLERVGELNSRCSRLEQENAERLKNIKLWQSENESVVVELADAEANHSQMAEEHKELEDERLRLTEERATMHAGLTQKANHAATLLKRAEEFTLQLVQKKEAIDDLLDEMMTIGCDVADDNVALPSVADAEANARKLDHRLNKIGDVNMLAIEQYDITEARLSELKQDNKTLQQRRKSLIDLTDRLEKQRKARLLHVLKCVDKNFRAVYETLSGGRGELFLENPKDPFKAGLSMWCQPSGKSSKCKLSLLSGGEQSMAALSLIFAIQDYDPSPFYYFDEVDQNLDAFNAEKIAKMCRERSKQAQFIMVTLRKVSLQLADHHIGITHAGDGCSRRIANFDKKRAIELGAAALKELENEKSLAKVREGSIIDSSGLPNVDNMPTTPEELPLPSSLGGLAERAEEMAEDIEEHQEVRRQVIEETTTVEITEQQEDDLDLEGLLED